MRVAQACQPLYYRKNRANKRLVPEEFFYSVNTWPDQTRVSSSLAPGGGKMRDPGNEVEESAAVLKTFISQVYSLQNKI